MNWLLAPDSFKNCLSAIEVCRHLENGIREADPGATVVSLPLADGGEGTVRAAAAAADGVLFTLPVTGPLGAKVDAEYTLLPDRSAVLEMAQTSGIEQIPPGKLNPMRTTTYGFGELIAHLLDQGVRDFTLGIGGSATVDGGSGMFQALGGELTGSNGSPLPPGAAGGTLSTIRSANSAKLHPALARSRFRIACDVTNPLTGKSGAAAVFGPQKGATPQMVEALDNGLAHWAALWQDQGASPGDGAAGGLGFALRRILHGHMQSGAELMLQLADFDSKAARADLIITGEGRSDSQSLAGKLPGVVARHAHALRKPVFLISGALAPDLGEFASLFAGCLSIAEGPGPLEPALLRAPLNLHRLGRTLASLSLIN